MNTKYDFNENEWETITPNDHIEESIITKHRKRMNLRQEDLATMIGVGVRTIYRWEERLTIPNIKGLIALSKVFKISLHDLSITVVEEYDRWHECILKEKNNKKSIRLSH